MPSQTTYTLLSDNAEEKIEKLQRAYKRNNGKHLNRPNAIQILIESISEKQLEELIKNKVKKK